MVYLAACSVLASPSLIQMADVMEISWHKAESTGFGIEKALF